MDLKRKKIGVLMGGLSGEREVSLSSGEQVYQALIRKGYRAMKVEISDADQLVSQLPQIQVAFICLHGGFGEDGTLQLLLELLNIPYVGSRPLACALAMDKLAAKRAFQSAGLPTAPWLEYRREPWAAWSERVKKTIGFPCVVKPVHEGSSLGVQIIRSAEDLIPACAATKRQYREFFVESYIPGKEITAGVLLIDGEDRVLPLLELRPKREFYDYEAKYTPGLTDFIVPADLNDAMTRNVQEIALRAFQTLGCSGFARVDLRVTEGHEPFLLEVNTYPGLTPTSDLPQMAQAASISFDDLVERMLQTAVEKLKTPVASVS
jgi:D-alanine-D-alanine ligase